MRIECDVSDLLTGAAAVKQQRDFLKSKAHGGMRMLDHSHSEAIPPLDDQAHEKDMLTTLVPVKEKSPSADNLEAPSASTPADGVPPDEKATPLPNSESDPPLAIKE